MRNRHKKEDDNNLHFQRGILLENFRGIISPDQIVKVRTTPVAWGIPNDEIAYSKFWIFFEKHGYKMPWDDFIPSDDTYLLKARNYIHNTYLNKSSAPYLMMLDSDIIFPPHLVDLLIAHNKPVVGGWYKDKKASDHHPVVYDFVEDKDGMPVFRHRVKPGTGLEQVDATGAGCWLMSRPVAEILGESPYGHNVAGGEDFRLCRRLMELDIPLYVDWSINCAHVGVGIT